MYLPSLLLAAAMSTRVAYADFLVLTEAPIPTSLIPQFSRISDAASWTTSVFLRYNFNAWPQASRSLGAPYSSNSSSAASEISAFFATASNYSVDAIITEAGKTATITDGKPDWYDALPTGAREFKEMEVSLRASVLSVMLAGSGGGGAPATGTSSQGAAPTGASGGKGLEWALAAGAMAVFL